MPALEERGARGIVTEGRGFTPLVSIGLPVYNGERFLAQALDSLLGQTLQDFELIISDNASTDGTADICLDYAARDARIRYIRQPSNIGAPRNWNFVALEARGRYFKWASADDFCDPRMLEKCVAVLSADPSVVLCYGRACIVDEETGEHRPFAHDFSAVDPRPSERFKTVFRSLVLKQRAQGVIRLDVLRRTSLEPPIWRAIWYSWRSLPSTGASFYCPRSCFTAAWGRELGPCGCSLLSCRRFSIRVWLLLRLPLRSPSRLCQSRIARSDHRV